MSADLVGATGGGEMGKADRVGQAGREGRRGKRRGEKRKEKRGEARTEMTRRQVVV